MRLLMRLTGEAPCAVLCDRGFFQSSRQSILFQFGYSSVVYSGLYSSLYFHLCFLSTWETVVISLNGHNLRGCYIPISVYLTSTHPYTSSVSHEQVHMNPVCPCIRSNSGFWFHGCLAWSGRVQLKHCHVARMGIDGLFPVFLTPPILDKTLSQTEMFWLHLPVGFAVIQFKGVQQQSIYLVTGLQDVT